MMLAHVLSQTHQILEEARQKLSVDMATSIEQVYRTIETLIHFVNREIEIIENNVNLDEHAKRTARREVLENAGRKFEVIKTKRANLNLDQELKAKLLNASVPEEDVDSLLKFLREREVRDRLSGMTEAQIKSHFGDSLFDGSNPLLVDAILNAPQGFELFPETTLKKLRWTRAITLNPELASEFEMAREMNSMSNKMLMLVKNGLDSSRKKEIPVAITKKNITD